MPDVVAKLKSAFFNRAAVLDKLDPATRRWLSKAGAFVRQRARSSLRYATGASAPGKPPVVHRSVGFTRKKKVKGNVVQQPASPLRELLFFAFDPVRKSVIVGPAIGGSQTGAPETLERGGNATVIRHGRKTTVRIGARPTMAPAFAAELPKIMEAGKDIV